MTIVAVLVGLLLGIGVLLVERRLGWRVGFGLAIAFTAIALGTWKATDDTDLTIIWAMLGFAVPGIVSGAWDAVSAART